MRRLLDPYLRLRVVARLMQPWWRWRFAEFGRESFLYRPAWLYRPEMMAIGDRVWISQDAWLEVHESVVGPPALRIGNGVVIRHHVIMSVMDSITIEEDASIGAFSS